MLTGKQIIDRKIVTNHCPEGIQQQGVDVRLASVARLRQDDFGHTYMVDGGFIPSEGKSQIPNPVPMIPEHSPRYNAKGWLLRPGYYEITFAEGVNIPSNAALWWKTRSSLVRCGAIIHSGQFDAGFKTDHAGAFIEVQCPIFIEEGARVAQAVVFESSEVQNLYAGQWQEDCQRSAAFEA